MVTLYMFQCHTMHSHGRSPETYTYCCKSFPRFGEEIGGRKFTNFSFSELTSMANVRNRSLQIFIKMAIIDQKMGTDNQGVSEY